MYLIQFEWNTTIFFKTEKRLNGSRNFVSK